MQTYTLANSIVDGPITDLLSIVCSFKEVLSLAHAKVEKCLSGFKFGIFIGRFPSDGEATMAVKGLMGGELVCINSCPCLSSQRNKRLDGSRPGERCGSIAACSIQHSLPSAK